MTTTITPVSGSPDLAALLASGDIQGALQLVMGNRVQLLDAQLADQIKAVQARNDQVSQLNDLLSKLTAFEAGIKGTDATSSFDQKNYTQDQIDQEKALNGALRDTGVDVGIPNKGGQNSTPDQASAVGWGTTRGQLDTAITKVKGLIDTASNNQQMDMLRLQSLNNKRDEAFDLLTTTQKSFHDASTGIIQHM